MKKKGSRSDRPTRRTPARGISISAEIPKRSAGRVIDALTDIISPISEASAWLGDKITLKRQDTLAEIARKTRERLLASRQPVRPIPQKFLVPIIEKASLEDLDNQKLIDMWANLLATAATEEVELLGQYGSILSEITSAQVGILEQLLGLDHGKAEDGGALIDHYFFLNQTGLPGAIAKIADHTTAEAFCDALLDEMNFKGVAIDTVNVFYQDESLEHFPIIRNRIRRRRGSCGGRWR